MSMSSPPSSRQADARVSKVMHGTECRSRNGQPENPETRPLRGGYKSRLDGIGCPAAGGTSLASPWPPFYLFVSTRGEPNTKTKFVGSLRPALRPGSRKLRHGPSHAAARRRGTPVAAAAARVATGCSPCDDAAIRAAARAGLAAHDARRRRGAGAGAGRRPRAGAGAVGAAAAARAAAAPVSFMVGAAPCAARRRPRQRPPAGCRCRRRPRLRRAALRAVAGRAARCQRFRAAAAGGAARRDAARDAAARAATARDPLRGPAQAHDRGAARDHPLAPGDIVIPDPAALERNLSKYYKHSKYASFQRQLNNFGYRRQFVGQQTPAAETVYERQGASENLDDLLALRPVRPAP